MEKKQGRGRPRQPEDVRRRASLTFRIRDETKAALENLAAANGRSLSEEAETRLQRSLEDQRLMVDAMHLLYGRRLTELLLEVASAMRAVREFRPFHLSVGDKDAFDNPWRFDQMAQAATVVIEAHRPSGKIVPPRRADVVVPTSITDPAQRAAIERMFSEPAEKELKMGVNLAKALIGARGNG